MTARELPPERTGGQDDPPDVAPVLLTVIRLLDDLAMSPDVDADLRLRANVTRRVVARLRKRLEGLPR